MIYIINFFCGFFIGLIMQSSGKTIRDWQWWAALGVVCVAAVANGLNK